MALKYTGLKEHYFSSPFCDSSVQGWLRWGRISPGSVSASVGALLWKISSQAQVCGCWVRALLLCGMGCRPGTSLSFLLHGPFHGDTSHHSSWLPSETERIPFVDCWFFGGYFFWFGGHTWQWSGFPPGSALTDYTRKCLGGLLGYRRLDLVGLKQGKHPTCCSISPSPPLVSPTHTPSVLTCSVIAQGLLQVMLGALRSSGSQT